MKEQMDQKIEAYLGGDMTPEEQREFELEIAQNPQLQKEVHLSNAINHYLNQNSWLSVDDKNQARKEEIEEFINSEQAQVLKSKLIKAAKKYKNQENKKIRFRNIAISIAAILIIGFFVTILFDSKSGQKLYAEYYSTNDLPSLVKRNSRNDLLQQGLLMFKNDQFDDTVTLLSEYTENVKEVDPLIYSYIGFSYLELGDMKTSIDNFDRLLYSNSIDRSRALWYKTLAYLKYNKTEDAKRVLSEIIRDTENFNYNKAIQLLDELE